MTTLRKFLFAVLLVGLMGSAPAWAAVQAASYGTTESTHDIFQHAQYEYYFNNSGGALPSGTVVVFDRTGTGVNLPTRATADASASRNSIDVDGTDGDVTNVGTYITTTTTADDDSVAGVTDDDSCADQSYCRVQIFGPRLVSCANSTDAVTSGNAVGTTTVAGQCGGGSGLGVALQGATGETRNNDNTMVFIRLGLGSN